MAYSSMIPRGKALVLIVFFCRPYIYLPRGGSLLCDVSHRQMHSHELRGALVFSH